MKRNINKTLLYLVSVCFPGLLISCNQYKENNQVSNQQKERPISKPNTTSSDSLLISSPSVVFFEPDSVQLEKIRRITEGRIFESNQHDFAFQSHTAKMYVKEHKPEVKIVEAKNYRWLIFLRSDSSREIIDLDKIEDAWGMYIFEPHKKPQLSDMMNVDTEIPRYFSK